MTEPAKLLAAFVLGALFMLVLMREVNAPREEQWKVIPGKRRGAA